MKKYVVCALALASFACGGGNAAAPFAKAPEYAPEGQTKCRVKASQASPLIVEWPSSDRAALEALAKRALVPVRYSGCEMELLPQCSAPGKYAYVPITPKHDKVTVKNADDLYANLPLGAARLEGKLATAGELDVTMTIVGRLEANDVKVDAKALQGECAKATHVVAAMTVGAFDFYAAGHADVGGGANVLGGPGVNASSSADKETLDQDGDDQSCAKATSGDSGPPFGCGALLRLEVVPLQGTPLAAAASGGDVLETLRDAEARLQQEKDEAAAGEIDRARGRIRPFVEIGAGATSFQEQVSLDTNACGGSAKLGATTFTPSAGLGARYGLSSRFELLARAAIASGFPSNVVDCSTPGTKTQNGYQQLYPAFDAELRVRPRVSSGWYVGAGPRFGWVVESNDVTLLPSDAGNRDFPAAATSSGSWFHAGGVVETGYDFGPHEEWEIGARWPFLGCPAAFHPCDRGTGGFMLGVGFAPFF